MEATVFTPTQRHLLKLFSYNKGEDFVREVQYVLTQYFQDKLDCEADRLWDEGILDQQALDALRTEDFHQMA